MQRRPSDQAGGRARSPPPLHGRFMGAVGGVLFYTGSMQIDQGITGHLARVRHIDPDGLRVYFEYRSGATGHASANEPFDLEVDDLVLVDAESHSIERAPAGLWPEPTWIGVVRSKTDVAAI